jgi:hypothetical protein
MHWKFTLNDHVAGKNLGESYFSVSQITGK